MFAGRRARFPNLGEIFDYLKVRNPTAAQRILRIVGLAAHRLPRAPYVGRMGRVEGSRELVIQGTPYLIGYRVRESDIEILCVRHGARRWPETL
jgi:plasmid stabilization system protein ParE